MKNILPLMHKARSSVWALRWLNFILGRGIPFNRAHGFKIVAIKEHAITTKAGYQTRNFNHIRGIHACAIATIGEFSAGLMLMMAFVPREYRLIMSQLEVQYHYQAKQDLLACAMLEPQAVAELQRQLQTEDKVYRLMTTEIHDATGHHVATVNTRWQIKPWDKVKLQLP